MTPASGAISASDLNTALKRSSSTEINFNSSEMRGLAFVPSGAIKLSDCYSKDSVYFTAGVADSGFPDLIGAYGGISGLDGWIPDYATNQLNGQQCAQVVRGIPSTYPTYRLNVGIYGALAQDFFTTVQVNGVSADSSTASFGDVGFKQWAWDGVDTGLTDTVDYHAYFKF